MKIQYLENYTLQKSPVERHGGILNLLPGQDQFGYGAKITSDTLVVHEGKKYRMYITQFSNAGSCWIVKQKQKFFLR